MYIALGRKNSFESNEVSAIRIIPTYLDFYTQSCVALSWLAYLVTSFVFKFRITAASSKILKELEYISLFHFAVFERWSRISIL